MSRRWFVPIAFAVLAAVPVRSDAQPLPAASGHVIEAADGDVVVVPSGARVSVGPSDREVAMTPPPVAVVRATSASGRAARGSFDEIEQAWLAGGDNALQGSGPRAGVQMRAWDSVSAAVAPSSGAAQAGAVRVGGSIRPPTRTHVVEPAYPQAARAAGVQGVVILEIVIGADGAVSNARVLRSIPLLDQAALDAVRQWRYEPTLLNGVPTPVVMTATVNFSPSPSAP
jgi:protein TonB